MQLATDWQILGSPAADWITTIVAVAALIVAGIAARYTSQTNRAQQETLELQRKQYEESQEAARRSQAEKVTFWGAEDATDAAHVYLIQNSSDSPVFQVQIVLGANDDADVEVLVSRYFILPTGASPERVPSSRNLATADEASLLQLQFLDSAGRFWSRDFMGHLIMLGSWDPATKFQ